MTTSKKSVSTLPTPTTRPFLSGLSECGSWVSYHAPFYHFSTSSSLTEPSRLSSPKSPFRLLPSRSATSWPRSCPPPCSGCLDSGLRGFSLQNPDPISMVQICSIHLRSFRIIFVIFKLEEHMIKVGILPTVTRWDEPRR